MFKFNPFTGKLDLVGTPTAVSQYAEPVIGASNDTVIYEDNSNPVPDFLFDVDGSFIMELVTI